MSPANSDLATSDAVKLATDVDPEGKRTIGVLTKLDIMDDGTDARDVLTGNTMPLQHGWIAVVNRSQGDIFRKKNLDETRKKERDFFENNKAYADLKNTGITSLSEKLCSMLQEKIVLQIPRIRDFLQKSIVETKEQLEMLPEAVQMDRASMFKIILEISRKFENEYRTFVDEGDGGGHKILATFEEEFIKEIGSVPLLEKFYTKDKVTRIIDVSNGWQRHLMAPEAGYRKLITMGIETMKEPSIKCVDSIHEILKNGINFAMTSIPELDAYAVLRSKLEEIAIDTLMEVCKDTKASVRIMIQGEAAYIDTEVFRKCSPMSSRNSNTVQSYDMTYMSMKTSEHSSNIEQEVGEETFEEPMDEMSVIGKQCHDYVKRVMKQLIKSIPRMIILKSIIASKNVIIQKFYDTVGGKDDDDLKMILSEDPQIELLRDKLNRQMELLSAAKLEVAGAGIL